MDGLEIAELLESDADIALVEREDQLAREMGVTGVPAMIFGGRLAVSGARDADVLLSVINRAAEMQAGGGQADENDADEDEER
jgi:predicted DsbA family dithiol-disulfide isomerase